MSAPAHDEPLVRVLQRIDVCASGSVVTADPGVFDAAFLCEMLGQAAYMEAYANGRIQVIHE